jgi:hypothetical protein
MDNNADLVTQLKSSLIGRIKLNICNIVSGTKDKVPQPAEVAEYIGKLPRKGYSLMGFYHFWVVNDLVSIKKNTTPYVSLDRLLLFLETFPLKKARFYEVDKKLINHTTNLGFLFYAEKLTDPGYVYVFTLVDDNAPEKIFKVFELRASSSNPEPIFSEITTDTSIAYTRSEFKAHPFYKVVMTFLQQYYENPIGRGYYPLSKYKEVDKFIKEGKDIPPSDPKFNRLIAKALKNEIHCFRVIVNTSDLKLKNESHVSNIANDVISDEAERQEQENELGPLVYWEAKLKKFIVSDDYVSYLAFLVRRIEKVPAVVMGNFPEGVAKILEVGYRELIPGILMTKRPKENDSVYRKAEGIKIIREHKKRRSDFISNIGEVWIGINQISFGLLLSPMFFGGEWRNRVEDYDKLGFVPWTIGHVLDCGLVVPGKEEKMMFKSASDLMNFYLNVLVRASQSNYQYQLAQEYCRLVKMTIDPRKIPFLIPEYRYSGKVNKHEYRLDFAVLDFKTLKKVGIELSPWSTHGALKKTKEKSQKQINIEAMENRENEMIKLKRISRDLRSQYLYIQMGN